MDTREAGGWGVGVSHDCRETKEGALKGPSPVGLQPAGPVQGHKERHHAPGTYSNHSIMSRKSICTLAAHSRSGNRQPSSAGSCQPVSTQRNPSAARSCGYVTVVGNLLKEGGGVD